MAYAITFAYVAAFLLMIGVAAFALMVLAKARLLKDGENG